MEKQDFLVKCLEISNTLGDRLPHAAFEVISNFEWQITNHGRREDATKKTMTEALGDMYIILQMLAFHFNLDGAEVEKCVEKELNLRC